MAYSEDGRQWKLQKNLELLRNAGYNKSIAHFKLINFKDELHAFWMEKAHDMAILRYASFGEAGYSDWYHIDQVKKVASIFPEWLPIEQMESICCMDVINHKEQFYIAYVEKEDSIKIGILNQKYKQIESLKRFERPVNDIGKLKTITSIKFIEFLNNLYLVYADKEGLIYHEDLEDLKKIYKGNNITNEDNKVLPPTNSLEEMHNQEAYFPRCLLS